MAPFSPARLQDILDQPNPVLIPLAPFAADQVRSACLQRRPTLLIEMVVSEMAKVFDMLRPHIRRVIERLIQLPDLVIEDDLQEVVDLGLYNSRLGAFFETLWTARFERREGRDPTSFVLDLCESTFDDPSPPLRNDALLFWLTLMRQNDFAGAPQVILLLTSPSGFDLDTWTFIRAADHWESLGSPVRIVTDVASVS